MTTFKNFSHQAPVVTLLPLNLSGEGGGQGEQLART
jgi:hypothetical protein